MRVLLPLIRPQSQLPLPYLKLQCRPDSSAYLNPTTEFCSKRHLRTRIRAKTYANCHPPAEIPKISCHVQPKSQTERVYHQHVDIFHPPPGDWERYRYTPLPNAVFTVRLMQLEPGDGDEIHCKLRNVHLGDARVQYEALSYTWGSQIFQRFLLCEGKVLPVTQNLYDALKRLRQPDRPTMLWVDAVCINQEDTQERSHQVIIPICATYAIVIFW